MKNPIYILFLITIFSCQNISLKAELENTYSISAENEKDTLLIESFKILKKRNIRFDYIQNIRINNLKNTISTNKLIIKNLEKIDSLYKHNIHNRNRLIELNSQKKDEYLKEIEYDQQKLANTKYQIKRREHENVLTHQKIVLIRAEFEQNENEYEMFDYVFKGKINNEFRIDTMSVLKISEQNLKFIKNKMFTDYKGQ